MSKTTVIHTRINADLKAGAENILDNADEHLCIGYLQTPTPGSYSANINTTLLAGSWPFSNHNFNIPVQTQQEVQQTLN